MSVFPLPLPDPEPDELEQAAGVTRAVAASAATTGERLLALPQRRWPTGVFFANDLLAIGLLQHLTQHGIKVPEDVAIVGIHDIEYAAAAAVSLTSVAQPRQLLGRTAARLLAEKSASGAEHEHQHVVFPHELVARASTAAGRTVPS